MTFSPEPITMSYEYGASQARFVIQVVSPIRKENKYQIDRNHRNHPRNPRYNVAFTGMDTPLTSTPAGNWKLAQNNNHGSSYIQGGSALSPHAYGLTGGLNNNWTLSDGRQRLLRRTRTPPLANAPDIAHTYGVSMGGSKDGHGNLESSQLGLRVSGVAPANAGPQCQSTPSTPSLANFSPTLFFSPSFESGSHGSSSMAKYPAPAGSPLCVPVAALPKDKHIMFKRVTGKILGPKSPENREDGLDRSQSMLPEDLYALIGSGQVPTQTKLPDNLLEPILPKSGFGNCMSDWCASPVSLTTYEQPTSNLKALSTRTRTRTIRVHQHHQYSDYLLRSRCPESRIDALNVAIQFREAHGADQLIPNDLVDEQLEQTADGKFTFWGERAQKARSITGARDLVRKSLGNFPFRCSNLGCQHSSLRQADLNKHMKTCKFPSSPFSPNVTWGIQNFESSAQDLGASFTPQQQNMVVDASPMLDITNAGEDVLDNYLTFPPFGDEFEAGIDGAE